MIQTTEESLFHLLLRNLPKKIHCSQTKSGSYSAPAKYTSTALKNYSFIEFNSKEKISIVVLDKDIHNGVSAREYFGDLLLFQDWLLEMTDLQPTYICETTNGFQFGYVIRGFIPIQNGFNPKNSPQQFLADIQKKFIRYLSLDEIASSRQYGIFRNPLKHKFIANISVVYNLQDLNNVFQDIQFDEENILYTSKKQYCKVSKYNKITSNRNNSIFKLCCREFAYSKPTKTTIFQFANNINQQNCYELLPSNEIKSIAQSIYKRCQNNSLKSGSKKAMLNREKLVKNKKKYIIKYFLRCKKENIKPIKSQLAKELCITVQSLNSTYGNFMKKKYKI